MISRRKAAPELTASLQQWKKRVIWGDGIIFGLIFVLFLFFSTELGYWQGLSFAPPWLESFTSTPWMMYGSLIVILLVIYGLHHLVRSITAKGIMKKLSGRAEVAADIKGDLSQAFYRNTRPWRTIFSKTPAGWGHWARKRLYQVTQDADGYVQILNDRFTNPSGDPAPDGQQTTENEATKL